MSNITNNFEPGSVTMNAGSSMNGDVHIGNVYNGQAEPQADATLNDSSGVWSPLRLSKARGTKIDFIRVMNAWYECGKVETEGGGKPTKKEFFTWVGKLFNMDLSNYDKDLSNSMASGVHYEKQSRIFDELKDKHEEIYNSK